MLPQVSELTTLDTFLTLFWWKTFLLFFSFCLTSFLFCFTLHSVERKKFLCFYSFFFCLACLFLFHNTQNKSFTHSWFSSSHVFLPKTTAVIKIGSWDGTTQKSIYWFSLNQKIIVNKNIPFSTHDRRVELVGLVFANN